MRLIDFTFIIFRLSVGANKVSLADLTSRSAVSLRGLCHINLTLFKKPKKKKQRTQTAAASAAMKIRHYIITLSLSGFLIISLICPPSLQRVSHCFKVICICKDFLTFCRCEIYELAVKCNRKIFVIFFSCGRAKEQISSSESDSNSDPQDFILRESHAAALL